MKVSTVSAQSHRLTRFGLINCYLVREADGFTLVDTGMGGGAAATLAAAAGLGAPIRRILLTHAHGDHVGSVDALVGLIPGVELLASERSLPLLRRPVDKGVRPGEPAEAVRGSLPGIASTVTRVVAAGETVGSLRAVSTPGHCPGHFSFLDERDGTLFAGDEVVAVGRLALPGWTPAYFPLPTMATWSKRLVVDSARALMELPIRRFACGHGPVREGGREALAGLLAGAGGA